MNSHTVFLHFIPGSPDVTLRALSHHDGQAVRAVIEYGGRDAMTVLSLKPNDAFLKQCEKDQLLSTCFAICLES